MTNNIFIYQKDGRVRDRVMPAEDVSTCWRAVPGDTIDSWCRFGHHICRKILFAITCLYP